MSKFKCSIGIHTWEKPIPLGVYDTWETSHPLLPIQCCKYCQATRKAKLQPIRKEENV